jgi:hypothetical protein
MRDMKNNTDVVSSLVPATRTASADGAGVDLQGYESAMAVFHSGALTDGTHTPKMQESDDNSTFTDVAAGDLEGTLSALSANAVQRVGYKGSKRYVKAYVTVAGATQGGIYSACIMRGEPNIRPPV